MNQVPNTDRQNKINAIKVLLEYSLLFPISQKEEIKSSLQNFTDEQIQALGHLLAAEDKHRAELDKKLEEADTVNKQSSTP